MSNTTPHRSADSSVAFLAMVKGQVTTREYWGCVVYETHGLDPHLWWANERIKDMIRA